MTTPYLPIPSDPRYTVTHETGGHVLRFDGDAIATSEFLSPLIIAAQNHQQFRLGQSDRKQGLPCASANGRYLDGWYAGK